MKTEIEKRFTGHWVESGPRAGGTGCGDPNHVVGR
jgi:hypothetical protein